MAHMQRVATLVAAALAMAGGALAQQPTQRQVDSLAAQVHALQARLDSLQAAVSGMAPASTTTPAPPDTGLAALRAAAAAAV
ncbi:MAG TPA: hypothetical protein VLV15_00860, partial [Dongiaceae bacterium]|nr:hypothetical protein [Dongiaceae bacterium]